MIQTTVVLASFVRAEDPSEESIDPLDAAGVGVRRDDTLVVRINRVRATRPLGAKVTILAEQEVADERDLDPSEIEWHCQAHIHSSEDVE